MTEVLIENLIKILFAALLMLINVAGVYLTTLIGKSEKLRTVAAAVNELKKMAVLTAGELQQTVVDGLKAAASDHKLTEAEIRDLRLAVVTKTNEKMAPATMNLLNAAGVDIVAIIQGATGRPGSPGSNRRPDTATV